MKETEIYWAAGCIISMILAVISAIRERRTRLKYSGLADVKSAIENAKKSLDDLLSQEKNKRELLNGEYASALTKYERLKGEISSLQDRAEDISFGLYEPHFDFSSPDDYRRKIEEVREKQKILVRNDDAITCPVQWHVGNSRHEGQRMVKLNMKLAMRAFNGECDAALADVSWSNISRMEDRVMKGYDSINKLGEVLAIRISSAYLKLKLDELYLKYELEEKKYRDREEQRRIREQIKEEERANREIEQARCEAETEEGRFQAALTKAREEAAVATGAKLQKLIEQVSRFEAKLDEARKKKERAIARAQLTKSGFVYIISNIGSFGEKVFKIGMTRRLEPMDRIYELSGASVPFPFDLHAMLYSDNAPELETALHHHFENRRLNLVNARREFYYDIELGEIEEFVRSRGLSAQFIPQPEAREFKQTLARRDNKLPRADVDGESQTFAPRLFDEEWPSSRIP